MDFRGAAKRLDDIDIPRIGARIGIGEDVLHAVMEVETRGSGFDPKGRPKMLFEPHIFWRDLGAGRERDEAVAQRLAYPKWGTRPYPADSYPRLEAAMKIHERAALRSASWGLGQIMGFNANAAGYSSEMAMVLAFMRDEEDQLDAMVRFIVSKGLDDALRRHDWAAFAKGYNGAAYAKHGYHVKLAEAYKKWQGIADTPFAINRTVGPVEPSGFWARVAKLFEGK